MEKEYNLGEEDLKIEEDLDDKINDTIFSCRLILYDFLKLRNRNEYFYNQLVIIKEKLQSLKKEMEVNKNGKPTMGNNRPKNMETNK